MKRKFEAIVLPWAELKKRTDLVGGVVEIAHDLVFDAVTNHFLRGWIDRIKWAGDLPGTIFTFDCMQLWPHGPLNKRVWHQMMPSRQIIRCDYDNELSKHNTANIGRENAWIEPSGIIWFTTKDMRRAVIYPKGMRPGDRAHFQKTPEEFQELLATYKALGDKIIRRIRTNAARKKRRRKRNK